MRIAHALVVVGLVAGCRRIDPGSLNDAPRAPEHAQFDRDVYPILRERCGDCHRDDTFERVPTRFVANDPSFGYLTATGFYALTGPFTSGQAPILRRIGQGDHASLVYSDDERAAITRWLDTEVALRGGIPLADVPARSALVEAELARYRGCMTLADFEAADMGVWATLSTDEGARCAACHARGDGGFVASSNVPAFYDAMVSRLDRFLPYLTVDVYGEDQVVNMNSLALARVSNAEDPHRMHPRFSAFANPGIEALRAFDDRVRQRISGGTCAPAPFPLRTVPSDDG